MVLSNPNDEMANEQMNVLYKTEESFLISFSDWSKDHPFRADSKKALLSYVDRGNSVNANMLKDAFLPMGKLIFPPEFR